MVKKSSLTVTDRRVYGKTMFGVRVDIPLDSISSVGIGTMDTIIVASSSGRLKFIGVRNKEKNTSNDNKSFSKQDKGHYKK